MLRDLLLYLSDRFRTLIAGVWNLLRFSYSLHTILFFFYCSSTANYNLHMFFFLLLHNIGKWMEVFVISQTHTNTHYCAITYGVCYSRRDVLNDPSHICLSRSCINHCAIPLRAKTNCNAFYRKLFFFVLLCCYTHHLTHGFDFLKMKWKKLDEHYLSRIDSLSLYLSFSRSNLTIIAIDPSGSPIAAFSVAQ